MDRVSFQRVIVPLLRLVTQPRFAHSTLTELRNPVLATIHSLLPLDRVQSCITALADTGSVGNFGTGSLVRSSFSTSSCRRSSLCHENSAFLCSLYLPLERLSTW